MFAKRVYDNGEEGQYSIDITITIVVVRHGQMLFFVRCVVCCLLLAPRQKVGGRILHYLAGEKIWREKEERALASCCCCLLLVLLASRCGAVHRSSSSASALASLVNSGKSSFKPSLFCRSSNKTWFSLEFGVQEGYSRVIEVNNLPSSTTNNKFQFFYCDRTLSVKY
jgi:hypothetical protein